MPTQLTNEDFTDMLLSYIEYGLQLTGNQFVRDFSEEVYAVAKQLPILELSKKLQEMVIDHYVYGRDDACSLPSPFHNFILDGLHNKIDWDDVALVVSDTAQKQMQVN